MKERKWVRGESKKDEHQSGSEENNQKMTTKDKLFQYHVFLDNLSGKSSLLKLCNCKT